MTQPHRQPRDDIGELAESLDRSHAEVGRAQRRLLSLIVRADDRERWEDLGARDLAHWLSIRYGISSWKARRWIVAAHALEELPGLSEALASGVLSLDKVVELARFAHPDTEPDLIRWASHVSVGAIRHRGDVLARRDRDDVVQAEQARTVSWWWFDDERRFGLQAELPAAQGALVASAIDRMAERVPVMPGEEGAWAHDARRADALVALCSAAVASDPDPDRATVVVHAQLDGLLSGEGGCEIEGATAIDPDTARRLLCNARVQTIVEGPEGQVHGIGRTTREPSAWMLRQIRYRDRGCRFPGCGSRRFTEAHHVRWWRHGGATELDNMVLICSFHHRLVHEYGWSMRLARDGTMRWFDAGGARYRAGPTAPAAA